MYRSTYSWPRHQLGVSVSFTPRPLYPRRKIPLYPLARRLCGPQNRSGRRGEEKNLAPTRTRTPTHSQLLYRLSYPVSEIMRTFSNWTDYKLADLRFLWEVDTDASEEHAVYMFYPEDGGSRFLRNVGNELPDYMPSSRNCHRHCHENIKACNVTLENPSWW
jgi:hypothetical protein